MTDRPAGSSPAAAFTLGPWLVNPLPLGAHTWLWLLPAYAVAWEIGFRVSTEYWFLPAGVRIAALLRLPASQWFVILLGEWLAILFYESTVGPGYGTLPGALLGTLGPFGCSAACIALWRRSATPSVEHAPQALTSLLLAVFAAAGLTAIALSSMLVIEDRLELAAFLDNLISYWVGDVVGILIIAPLLTQIGQPRPVWMRAEVWRSCLLSVLPLWLALWLALKWLPSAVPHLTLVALLPPIWMAFKGGWRGAALALTLTSIGVYILPEAARMAMPASMLQLMVAIIGFLSLLLGTWVGAEKAARQRLSTHVGLLGEANAALESKSNGMRVLAQRLVHAQENERSLLRARLANDLGDAVNALSAHLSLLARDVDHPQHLALVDTLRAHVQQIREAMNDCFEELQPSGQSLLGMLESGPIGRAFEAAGIGFRIDVEQTTPALGDASKLLAFRIAQHLASALLKRGDGRHMELRVEVDPVGGRVRKVSASMTAMGRWSARLLEEDSEFLALRDRVLAEGGEIACADPEPHSVRVEITFAVD